MRHELDDYPSSHSAAKARFVGAINRYRDLLLRRWWVLLGGVTLGLLAASALAWKQAPSFTSVGRMIVNLKLTLPEGSVYNEELGNFIGTQSALMQSSAVLTRAHARVLAQRLSPTNQPIQLKVAVAPKTTIFVLEARGPDPRYVQAWLQAAMEEYLNLKKEMRSQTSDTTVAGLTEEVLRLEKELRRADEEMAGFQQSNSVVLLEQQGNSAVPYLATLNQRLAALRSELDLLQTLSLDQHLQCQQELAATIPSANEPSPPASVPATAGLDYLKAKQQILLLKADQQDLAEFLRPLHPKMVALSEEIARRERLLDIYRKQSAEQLQSRKDTLALQIDNTQKALNDWNAKALEIQRKSAEFQRLKANSQRIQSLYDRLLATLQTLDLNKEISPESLTIIEPASPALPENIHDPRRVVLACLLSLGLGLALLLFIDRLDDRVNSLTELQDLFDEPVLGQIPREKPNRNTNLLKLIAPNDSRHALVESFRNLRSSLVYGPADGSRPRIILLTSSVPDEGKSLTAANLAIVLASSGSRVLLVDADLRKGILHSRFNLPPGPGLCEVVSRQVEWQAAVQSTPTPNLFLLPRGALAKDSSELLLAGHTRSFLRAAADQYDFVLLDTAPVMAADDVTSLAPIADAVLFVLRAERTSARVARAALDLLYQRRVRVLGLVFNAVRPASADYYYYRHRDYHTLAPTQASAKVGSAQP